MSETRTSHIIQQKSAPQQGSHRRPRKKTVRQNSGACATDHRAAVQEKTEMRHRDQEPHSGGRSLTANNDYAVTEYHTVVLETSTGHAVAESRRPERQGTLLKLPDRGSTRASTGNHRSHSGTCMRTHGSTGFYHAVMLEVPRRRLRNGKLPQSDIREQTKQRSAKISTRTRGGSDSTATAMLIRAQHVETTRGSQES